MKLYFALRTRAVRARWLLEGLGVSYELIKLGLARQENTTPAYLAVNPLGDLPALVDGEVTLRESLAICLHLADRFPEKQLAPRVGSVERGPYYQWMAFAEVSLDPVIMEFHKDMQVPEDQKTHVRSEEESAKLQKRLGTLFNVINAGLEGREFLVGDSFTAADVLMASVLHLANTLGLLDKQPRLVEYVRRHSQRPAVRKAVWG